MAVVCSWVAMNTVAEPARAHNARPRQTRWFRFPSRRVPFAQSIALAAAFLILTFEAGAQKRREAILRLRDDVSTAMAHSTLNEKQTEKLDRCRQTLILSAQSGRARKVTAKKDLDNALKDIEKVFHGEPFQPEDRDLVHKDIDLLRTIERNQRARRYARRRPY
jgi:hypothetical protein